MDTWTFGDYIVRTPPGSRLDVLCKELKREFPELRMSHKRNLWWHWIAHVLVCIFTLFLNRKYISAFTTTGRNHVAWGDGHHERIQEGIELDRVWDCLMHEREHLRQFARRGTFVMVIIWLFPPILLAYGRAIKIEKEGYIASLRAKWETDRGLAQSPEYRTWWVSQFTGPNYGWMWIRRKQVEGWFDTELARLKAKSA